MYYIVNIQDEWKGWLKRKVVIQSTHWPTNQLAFLQGLSVANAGHYIVTWNTPSPAYVAKVLLFPLGLFLCVKALRAMLLFFSASWYDVTNRTVRYIKVCKMNSSRDDKGMWLCLCECCRWQAHSSRMFHQVWLATERLEMLVWLTFVGETCLVCPKDWLMH